MSVLEPLCYIIFMIRFSDMDGKDFYLRSAPKLWNLVIKIGDSTLVFSFATLGHLEDATF